VVDVDLGVEEGEILCIWGPSGSGKTTLLNLLGCLDRPDSGSLLLGGSQLVGLPEKKLSLLRRDCFGFIFQRFHLLDYLTVLDNVALPLYYAGVGLWERRLRARELLDRVGLAHRADFHPGQISGGEAQRAAVARALVNRPLVVLADEPTGELDSANTAGIVSLIQDLNRQSGQTFVIVSHNPLLAQAAIRTLNMKDGRLLAPPGPEVTDPGASLPLPT